jgi:hypothetical protein
MNQPGHWDSRTTNLDALVCVICERSLGLRSEHGLHAAPTMLEIFCPPKDSKERRHLVGWAGPCVPGSKHIELPVPRQ